LEYNCRVRSILYPQHIPEVQPGVWGRVPLVAGTKRSTFHFGNLFFPKSPSVGRKMVKATKNREAYYGVRFRYRFGTTKMITEKWGLQLADEYMRQLANNKFSFNQNRLILTALLKINTSSQLQGGYMWLKWPSESQHIATFSFQKTISMHASKRDDK
jgi:hypothetical protein